MLNPMHLQKMKNKRSAYTLTELLAVVSIIGIMAAGLYAGWGYVREAADIRDASIKAASINAAKLAYSLKYKDYATRWSAYSLDASKYAALRSESPSLLPMTPADYSQYVPARVNMTIGSIDERTSITLKADGSEIQY